MKSFAVLLALASLVVASPTLVNNAQIPLGAVQNVEYPGYNLDLAELRLVQVEGQDPVWVSELEKINMKAQGMNFFDITDTQALGANAHLRILEKPSYHKPNASDLVKPVLKKLSTDGPKENLKHFKP